MMKTRVHNTHLLFFFWSILEQLPDNGTYSLFYLSGYISYVKYTHVRVYVCIHDTIIILHKLNGDSLKAIPAFSK